MLISIVAADFGSALALLPPSDSTLLHLYKRHVMLRRLSYIKITLNAGLSDHLIRKELELQFNHPMRCKRRHAAFSWKRH